MIGRSLEVEVGLMAVVPTPPAAATTTGSPGDGDDVKLTSHGVVGLEEADHTAVVLPPQLQQRRAAPGAMIALFAARGATGACKLCPSIYSLANVPNQTKNAELLLGRLEGRRVLPDGTHGAPRDKGAIKMSRVA